MILNRPSSDLSGKKQDHMVVKCLECETPKRFPTRADYRLWSDQPAAWFAMFPPEAPFPVPSSSSNVQGAAVNQDETKCDHRRCKDFSYCRKEVRIKRRAQSRVSSTDIQEDNHVDANRGVTKSTENPVNQSIEVNDTSERVQECVHENMVFDSIRKNSSEEMQLQEDINGKHGSPEEENDGEINANKTDCSPDALCVILNAASDNHVESAKSKSKSCDNECEIVSVSETLKRPSIDHSNEILRSKRRRSNEKEICPR